MKTKWVLGMVLAVGMVFAVGSSAFAEKPFPGKLLSILPILHKDNRENCKICHTQIKNPDTGEKDPKWNVFGETMKKAKAELKEKNKNTPSFEDLFNAVKDQDADGDGVSNLVELVAGSRPGEKESKPSEEQIKAAQEQITGMTKDAGAVPPAAE